MPTLVFNNPLMASLFTELLVRLALSGRRSGREWADTGLGHRWPQSLASHHIRLTRGLPLGAIECHSSISPLIGTSEGRQ